MSCHTAFTRRRFLCSGGVALALTGCAARSGPDVAAELDARVNATAAYLTQTYPSAAPLVQSAAGVLYMPLMTEAGFGLGGAYGQGALRIGGATVAYYMAARATVGVQAGVQQYAHALIFRTPQALAAFRASPGWVAGANAFYALPQGGMVTGTDTMAQQIPVVAMIFGQSGLMAGAAIEGTKYTPVTPVRVEPGRLGLPRLAIPGFGPPPA